MLPTTERPPTPQAKASFDHLIGTQQDRLRHVNAELAH
jgi:hypothetical protein